MPMNPRLLRPTGQFDPRRIAGLELWVDASDVSTITLNGSNVSEWRDKSGNGVHATQTTFVNQPAFSATSWSGRPSVNFTRGSSHFLEFTPFVLTTQTVFFVIEPTASMPLNSGSTILQNIQSGAGQFNRWDFTNADGYQSYSAALGSAVSGNVSSVGAGLFAQSKMLISHTYNNGGSTTLGNHGIRKDRAAVTTNSSGLLFGSSGLARGRIGCRSPGPGPTNDLFISANYAMILIYSRVLSAAEINAVENWAVGVYPL